MGSQFYVVESFATSVGYRITDARWTGAELVGVHDRLRTNDAGKRRRRWSYAWLLIEGHYRHKKRKDACNTDETQKDDDFKQTREPPAP